MDMTNEQKRQMLEYMGYSFHIPESSTSYVITPDEWEFTLAYRLYYRNDDRLNAKQLAHLIDIAWQHLEAREQAWQIEYIAHGTVRYIDIQAYPELVKLYYEINSKFEDLNYPQVMKMFYDDQS